MEALVVFFIKTLAPLSTLPASEAATGLANSGPLQGSTEGVGEISIVGIGVSVKVEVGWDVSLGTGVSVNVDVGGMADIIPTIIVLTRAVSDACTSTAAGPQADSISAITIMIKILRFNYFSPFIQFA